MASRKTAVTPDIGYLCSSVLFWRKNIIQDKFYTLNIFTQQLRSMS